MPPVSATSSPIRKTARVARHLVRHRLVQRRGEGQFARAALCGLDMRDMRRVDRAREHVLIGLGAAFGERDRRVELARRGLLDRRERLPVTSSRPVNSSPNWRIGSRAIQAAMSCPSADRASSRACCAGPSARSSPRSGSGPCRRAPDPPPRRPRRARPARRCRRCARRGCRRRPRGSRPNRPPWSAGTTC